MRCVYEFLNEKARRLRAAFLLPVSGRLSLQVLWRRRPDAFACRSS